MTAKKPAVNFKYPALTFNQRQGQGAPKFVLFHVPAGELTSWADVDRLQHDNKGAQRPLKELKVKKIAKFLQANPKNTIPTAVIVAIDETAATLKPSSIADFSDLTIKLSSDKKPGLIIDGQHRAHGILKHSGDYRICVIGILGADDAERAFQFVIINNTASRISQDHIKALNLSYDREVLNERLIDSAGVALGIKDSKYVDLQVLDQSEPFKGLLDWPTNKAGYIAPNAVESALAETYDRSAILGIDDLAFDVFVTIWARIKEIRASVWNADSKLLRKASIWALTVFILDTMAASQRLAEQPIDFTDDALIKAQVDRIVKRIPEEFWTAEWTAKELDTSSGRQKIIEALEIIDSNARFGKSWYDKVTFIDPVLIVGQTYEEKKPKRKGKATKKAS